MATDGGNPEGLRRQVAAFAAGRVAPLVARMDQGGAFPRDVYRELAPLGVLAPTLPTPGGAPIGLTGMVAAMEELASVSPAFALSVQLACYSSEFLSKHGNHVQRQLGEAVARGVQVVGVAMTEPEAGSDLAGLTTRAERQADGYTLSGRKVFVNMGGEADWVIVLARTGPEAGHSGVSTLLVARTDPGFQVGAAHRYMGMRGLASSTINLVDCRIPEDRLVGQAGKGTRQALDLLETGRIAVAAQGLGLIRAAIDLAARRLQSRMAFGGPLGQQQGLQFQIADLEARYLAARALTGHAAALRDAGQTCTKEASAAKLLASDLAVDAASFALQVHGASGYEEEHPAARLFRDARGMQIYEGANEIQRLVIGRQRLKEVAQHG